MKYVILSLLVLSSVALAQNNYVLVYGPTGGAMEVHIGGTVISPTIVNHAKKAVLGWIVIPMDAAGRELPSQGYVDAWGIISSDTPGIQPGEEKPFPSNGNRVIHREPLPEVASMKLDAILFADGEVVGPDTLRNVFPALQGFTQHLHGIQQQFTNLHTMRIPQPYQIPNRLSNRGFRPAFDPPPNYYPAIVNWSDNDSAAGTIYPPTNAYINTPEVFQDAICGMGSPYAGYNIGGGLAYAIGCYNGSDYYGVAQTYTKRPDGQPDRLFQHYVIKRAGTTYTQNNYQQFEACIPGDDGRIGTPKQEWNDIYPC